MADEPEDTEKEKSGKKLNPKLLAIVGVVVAAAAYFFLFSGGGEVAEAGVTTTTISLAEEEDGAIIASGTLTVNLADPGVRFGRVSFALVLVLGVDPLTVEPKLPLILDAALSELAGFSADDLLGLDGQERLRSVLSDRAREILNSEDERIVKRVVLTDLLVQ